MKDVKHGRITAYTYHKCRCDECRAAWAEYSRKYRKRNPRDYKEYGLERLRKIGGSTN